MRLQTRSGEESGDAGKSATGGDPMSATGHTGAAFIDGCRETRQKGKGKEFQQAVPLSFLPPLDLPSDWEWASLSQLCKRVSVGHVGPTSEHFSGPDEGIPFIRSQDVRPGKLNLRNVAHVDPAFHAELRKSQLQAGDILIVRVGANRGDCCVVPEGTGPLNCANVVFARPIFRGGYLGYFLRSQLGQELLLSITTGAAQGVLNTTSIAALPVAVPPADIQQRIAPILSASDDLIENNTRRIQILEEMAQSIYREWFVNFRLPGHEQVDVVESALGPVPEGWEIRKLSEVASVHRGRSYKSSELVAEGGLPFLNLKCINRDGGFRRDGLKRFQGKFKDTQTAGPNDIIMAVTDMTQERRIVARAARVPLLAEQLMVFSMDLVKIEPRAAITQAYLYGMLRFSAFADQVKQYANGANVLHLNPSRIEDYLLPLPPATLQREYARAVDPLDTLCDVLANKSDNLRQTRDLLLPKLISGEIDVEDLDIDTGELAA